MRLPPGVGTVQWKMYVGVTDLPLSHLDGEGLGTPDTVPTTHLFIHSLQSFNPFYKPVQDQMGMQHSQGNGDGIHPHVSQTAGVFLGVCKVCGSAGTKMSMEQLADPSFSSNIFREKNLFSFAIKSGHIMN